MPDDRFTVEITDIAYGGDGVGRLPDGVAVFVPFTAIGDRVTIDVYERARSYARADLVRVEEPGPNRTEPQCPVFERCGGCRYQHLTLDEQHARKVAQLRDSLTRIGQLENLPEIETPGPAPEAYGYRSKISLHLTGAELPQEALAYHSVEGDTLVPITACPIAHPDLNEALSEMIISGSYRDLGSPRQDDPVVLRRDSQGEVVVFRRAPGDRLTETVAGRKLASPAGGFHQVNQPVLEQLAAWLRGVAEEIERPAAMVDLFCGSGLFSVLLGDLAQIELLGVDSHPASVKAAMHNCKSINVMRSHFEVGRSEEHADALLKRGGKKGRVLAVVDPPRQGCHKNVTKALLAQAPDHILYVSCNPSTLARDLKRLNVGERYALKRLACFDMFPQTAHFESVALLERIGAAPDRKMHKLARD